MLINLLKITSQIALFELKGKNMKKNVKSLFGTGILAVVLAFSGCANSTSSSSISSTNSDTTNSTIASSEDTDNTSNPTKEQTPTREPLTITDMGGDVVTLPDSIDRVVSTSDPCTDMMVAFGQGDKLIGAYFRALDNPWFEVFFPGANELIAFDSYEPEAEALIAAETDIIFVPSRERALALREKGICALTIRYYSPDEVVYAADMLGQIFGSEAKAKSNKWIEDFNSARNEMAEKLKDVTEDSKPVAYEILADKGRGPFRTYYGDNQAWLSYAGGILATRDYADATSQAMPTEEAILATDPDIIFIGGTYATKEFADLLENDMWQDVTAVKNNEIYIEPTGATAWNSCSTSYPLLVYYCFSCMYPDKVDFDLKQMTHDFYLEYYEIDFTNEQLDLMLSSKAPDGTELWKE